MKTVTFDEYQAFVRNRPHLRDHITEGHRLAVAQWLDEEGTVQASALYQRFVDGEPVSRIYQINEE
jgi:hypothetical protein